jgi:hypothetical protein
MIEKWIEEAVMSRSYDRDKEVTPELERAYGNPDNGQHANPQSWYNMRRARGKFM